MFPVRDTSDIRATWEDDLGLRGDCAGIRTSHAYRFARSYLYTSYKHARDPWRWKSWCLCIRFIYNFRVDCSIQYGIHIFIIQGISMQWSEWSWPSSSHRLNNLKVANSWQQVFHSHAKYRRSSKFTNLATGMLFEFVPILRKHQPIPQIAQV